MRITKLLAASAIFCSIATSAGTVVLNEVSIATVVPPGHCELGGHPRDVAFVQATQSTVGKNNRILSMFAACEELDDFRRGTTGSFRRFGSFQKMTPGGRVSAIPNGNRPDYIAFMSGKGAPAIAAGFEAGTDRINRYSGPIGDSKALGVVAVDSSASYVATLMTGADDAGKPRTLVSVSGATFVKQMSFSVHYVQQYSGVPPLPAVVELQKRNLASFVGANEK